MNQEQSSESSQNPTCACMNQAMVAENGTEEENELLCQWRKCLEAGSSSSLPCPRNQLREEAEISWGEFNSCFGGRPRVPEEAEHGSHKGNCNPRILGVRSGVFICFVDLGDFKVPFEIIVENSYMCSALSKVFCLAILISVLKHADDSENNLETVDI
ncbi:hypothetical protein EK904_007863 [Melospiza melodia maxima]|nr:hypothetical protein EK904_007863 [Melospiza melodia maxima]